MMYVLGAFSFIFVGSCLAQVPGAPEVDYGVVFDSPIYVCDDGVSQGNIDTSKVMVSTVGNEATLSGNVNLLKGLQENTKLEIKLAKEIAGRYEMVLSHEICDLCAELENPDSNYAGYLKYFGVPEKCPFDPQEYPIYDFKADTKDLPVNSQNAGEYSATLNVYKTNGDCKDISKELLCCLKLDFLIEPV